jgi:hypothetical protein
MAALMRPGPGGKVDLKYDIFSRLRQANLNPNARSLLVNFIETYLTLDPPEQAEFASRLTPEGDTTMGVLEGTWADQYVKQGIEQGALRAKREMLASLVRVRFGTVPVNLETRLANLDEKALDRMGERVVQVASLEEFLADL